jgi:polyisoprenyl-teichoic acid--peptidoglycan teichoic acid transferase
VLLVLATVALVIAPTGRRRTARRGRAAARATHPRPATAREAVPTVGLVGRALLADLPPARRDRRGGRLRRAGLFVLALSCLLCAGAGVYAWQVTAALRDAEAAIVVPLPATEAAPATPPTDGSPAATEPTPTDAATPAGATGGAGGSQFGAIGAVACAATSDGDPGRDPIWRGRRYLNVLVLGFDARDGDESPPRSDVFMIAQLDLIAKTVNVVSVPRDLWVAIPGRGEERINAAYPLGWRADQPAAGVALAKRTVEQSFGIPIDYYISVDFRGFKQVVDAVGGIDVTVPHYLRDDEYPTEDYRTEKVEFFTGPQHMDGTTALKYARTRHQDSDYGRRRRQEQILLALFDKGKGVGIVARLPGVLRSLGGVVQTNFTFEEQLMLGRVAAALTRDDIGLYSIDETMTSGWVTPGGAQVVRGDWPTINALIARAFSPANGARGPQP